jgi:predicted HTH domain antitoxin
MDLERSSVNMKRKMREAAAIMRVPLRKALEELAQRGVYLRYGAEELEEDIR